MRFCVCVGLFVALFATSASAQVPYSCNGSSGALAGYTGSIGPSIRMQYEHDRVHLSVAGSNGNEGDASDLEGWVSLADAEAMYAKMIGRFTGRNGAKYTPCGEPCQPGDGYEWTCPIDDRSF